MLKIHREPIECLEDFEPWSGAIDTYYNILNANKLEELESILEEIYPDGINEGKLNDFLWHEKEVVYSLVGLNENGEEV